MSVLGEILSGSAVTVVAGGLSWLAGRAAVRRGQKVAAKRADGEAYDRAQRINQEVVDQLREEIRRLQEELRQLRTLLDAERTTSSALGEQVAVLERRVYRMRALLRQNGIDVPEEF